MTTETVRLLDGVREQHVLSGAERSLEQLIRARGPMMRAPRAQQAPGGLFAPPRPQQEDLL